MGILTPFHYDHSYLSCVLDILFCHYHSKPLFLALVERSSQSKFLVSSEAVAKYSTLRITTAFFLNFLHFVNIGNSIRHIAFNADLSPCWMHTHRLARGQTIGVTLARVHFIYFFVESFSFIFVVVYYTKAHNSLIFWFGCLFTNRSISVDAIRYLDGFKETDVSRSSRKYGSALVEYRWQLNW